MTTLTLLQLNDLHGYLEPHPELVRTEGGVDLTGLTLTGADHSLRFSAD